MLGHPDHGDEVHVAGTGVHLGDAVKVGDGLRCLADPVGGDVHEHDRGDHLGLLSQVFSGIVESDRRAAHARLRRAVYGAG